MEECSRIHHFLQWLSRVLTSCSSLAICVCVVFLLLMMMVDLNCQLYRRHTPGRVCGSISRGSLRGGRTLPQHLLTGGPHTTSTEECLPPKLLLSVYHSCRRGCCCPLQPRGQQTPASSGSQCGLDTGNSLGILQTFNTRLEPLRHPGV